VELTPQKEAARSAVNTTGRRAVAFSVDLRDQGCSLTIEYGL
jgi:hypothetical protein